MTWNKAAGLHHMFNRPEEKQANISDLITGGLSNLSHHGMGAPGVVARHVGESAGNLLKAHPKAVGGALAAGIGLGGSALVRKAQGKHPEEKQAHISALIAMLKTSSALHMPIPSLTPGPSLSARLKGMLQGAAHGVESHQGGNFLGDVGNHLGDTKAAHDVTEDKASLMALLPFGSTYQGYQRGKQTDRAAMGALRGIAGGTVGAGLAGAIGSVLGSGGSLAGGLVGKAYGTHLATRGLLAKNNPDNAVKHACALYKLSSAPMVPGLMNRIIGGAKAIGGAAQGAFQHGRLGAARGGNSAGSIGRGVMEGAKQFAGSRPGQNAIMGAGLLGAGAMAGRAMAPQQQQQQPYGF